MSESQIEVKQFVVPITISEQALQDGCLQLLAVLRPTWNPAYIEFKLFTDGITNKLIGCIYRGSSDPVEAIVVRVYGNKTDYFIDRKAELRNMKVLQTSGFSPKVLGTFQNGLAMEFIPGVILTVESVRQEKIYSLVAKTLAQMHKTELTGGQGSTVPLLWSKIEDFLALLPEIFTDAAKQERFTSEFGSASKLRFEYERLKHHLSRAVSPLVFAHNDLLLANVLYDETQGRVTLIDYEYAGCNYQAFDIANHFAEFVGVSDIDYANYPDRSFREAWLRIYLQEYLQAVPTSQQLQELSARVDQYVLAAHFLWGAWALLQAELSHIDFDYIAFASVRFGEYQRLKEDVFRQLS